MGRSTYTYVILELSEEAYNEIAKKLRDAGYDHAFDRGIIDMHGLAIAREGKHRETHGKEDHQSRV